MYKFAPASKGETIVFGSARPGYSDQQVQDWLNFMTDQGVQRVCCLLPKSQLARFTDLLDTYEQKFGVQRVCWSPIEDFQLCDREALTTKILPFLAESDQQNEKVVVHCSGGIGRTGHVLAAWLVYGRGLSNKAAIAAVRETGKNPREAAIAAAIMLKNPLKVIRTLDALLEECRLQNSYKS